MHLCNRDVPAPQAHLDDMTCVHEDGLLGSGDSECLSWSIHDTRQRKVYQQLTSCCLQWGCSHSARTHMTEKSMKRGYVAVETLQASGSYVRAVLQTSKLLSRALSRDPHIALSAVGVFPFRTHMTEKSMKMGYVAVETLKACSLFPTGLSARGHIYHFSEILEVGGSQEPGNWAAVKILPACSQLRAAAPQIKRLGVAGLQ